MQKCDDVRPMDIEKIQNSIGRGAVQEAESIFMDALEDTVTPKQIGEALTAFIDADKKDTAETLGWALLDAHADAPKDQTLGLAKAALLVLTDSAELRKQTAELYKEVHGTHPKFDDVYKSAGLETGQRPERALRTLDTCLAIEDETYLANRFDGRVIQIKRFSPLGEFDFTDDGTSESLEPKLLADEFEIINDDDFRVLVRKDPNAVKTMFQKDITAVLVSMCISHGGEIDTDRLKDNVVPKFIEAGKWSSWWSRVRTAVKKCPNLTIEGRNPSTIAYHTEGLKIEDQFADEVKKAYEPTEYLSIIQRYLKEVSARKAKPDAAFTGKIVTTLIDRVKSFARRRPADALAAVIVLGQIAKLSVEVPGDDIPTVSDILSGTADPADVICGLEEISLWGEALAGLKQVKGAAEEFKTLLLCSPVSQLDAIAAALGELECTDDVEEALAKAVLSPADNIDLCLWAWDGPAIPVANTPDKLTLLSKVLQGLFEIDHHWEGGREKRKDIRQNVRTALSARNFASYRQAVSEMDESMASVIRGKIERTDGLALAIRDQMLDVLKENFYAIFVEKKTPPWLDKNVIWTSQKALDAHAEELQVLTDVTMPANAKQIGEAAEQGDLRENADWQAAIEERDMLVARHRKINDELTRARVVQLRDVEDDIVSIGSKVTLKDSGGATMEMSFLGPWDTDTVKSIYSYTTKLGQAIMGKRVGDKIMVNIDETPHEYTIESLGITDDVTE
ncbi:MAG: GreA/GreB family elongation factor [Phycisphaerae bacterium]|nr:GreA/GreB family elongation factor [Phycisphaerae bacterium]